MKSYGFDQEAYAIFEEAALEHYDFVTCVRENGTYYGNGGTKCIRGTIATKKDLKAEKKKAKAGDKQAAKNVAKMEKSGVAGGGAGGAASDVPPPGSWKDQDKMEAAADSWRKKQGLQDETSEHDRIHMMVHSFAQKGSEEIGAKTNEKGVSSTEEVLVNLAAMNSQGYESGQKFNRALLIQEAKEMQEYLNDELSPAQKKNFGKAAEAAVDEFLDMSKKDDFDKFMMYVDAYGVNG